MCERKRWVVPDLDILWQSIKKENIILKQKKIQISYIAVAWTLPHVVICNWMTFIKNYLRSSVILCSQSHAIMFNPVTLELNAWVIWKWQKFKWPILLCMLFAMTLGAFTLLNTHYTLKMWSSFRTDG